MTLYGLIGYPLAHSYSKKFFTKRFQHDNLPCQYENFEIDDIAKIAEIISQNPDLAGLNVTSPYKEAVIPYLTDIDHVAKQIGSVNTIKISDSKLIGYNTDIHGFDALLTEAIGEKKVEKALVLGTGGRLSLPPAERYRHRQGESHTRQSRDDIFRHHTTNTQDTQTDSERHSNGDAPTRRGVSPTSLPESLKPQHTD